LEQACDSGWLGFLTYTATILGSIVFLYRYRCQDPGPFLVWLGVLGWALQSLTEFGLYIPALAWPAFTFQGLLWGRVANEVDIWT
jgi:hypothetical protein